MFYDLDQACEWAQEVAATGRVVDVVRRYRLQQRVFITAYPESERKARAMAWASYGIWGMSSGGM
jgi:hypothetical protein